MASGAFDPAEFAAFKAGTAAPAPTAFDPADFAAFKASQGASRRGPRPQQTPVDVANPFRPDEGSAPVATFDQRFNAAPPSSEREDDTPLGRSLRRVADEQLIGKPSAANAAAAATLRAGNAAGLNIPRNIAAGVATAAGALGVPGYGDRSFDENYRLAKDQEEALARQNPKSALAGTAVGIGAGAFALPATPLIGGTGIGARVGQGALTGFLYGGAGEFADSKELGSAALAAGIGAGAGGIAVPVIEKAAPVAKALYGMVSKGRPVTNESGGLTVTAKALLRNAGVPAETLTPEVEAGIARAVASKGESEAAIREALAGEFGIPLSRGQATGDAAALSLEDAARAGDRGDRARGVAQGFDQRQNQAIEAAGSRFADRAGRGVTNDNPQQAAEVVADQAREYSRRIGLEADDAQRAADEALAGLRGGSALDPVDAGAEVARGLRETAAARRAQYKAAYDDVAAIPGEFTPGALDRLGPSIRSRLGPEVPIDDVTTPGASRFLRDLEDLPGLFNLEPGAGPTLQQMEQLRRRLGIYASGSKQNPTDLRAIGKIREALDDHQTTAIDAGLFGPRAAPRSSNSPAGGFPGDLATDAASGGVSAAGGAPTRSSEPESLLRYLARSGGIPLDAEARAADLHRTYVPGTGTLARNGAPSWDQIRVRMAEEGFLPPDQAGAASSRDVADWVRNAIRDERINGRPTLRLADEEAAAGRRASEAVADQNADHAAMVDRQARRMAIDLEGYGLRPHELDRGALNDAAEHIILGRHTDPVDAYEAALMAREPVARSPRAAEDVPFDGPTAVAQSDALPSAAQDVGERLRKARALFREYQQTFAPQGAGDDVGLAMRSIVDRDREPVEVSRILYAGNPGRNMRMADRVKGIVGEDSPYWAAHQQGYLASILNGADMAPRAISARINDALTGERRGLTDRILNAQQVDGLRKAQTAMQTARSTRESVPEWITRLGRNDFDANRITADLFGSGVPGARPGSAAEAAAYKRFVGEDSAEWSGLRLAAWQRLAMKPDGSGLLPARQLAQRITEFTNGKGRGLAYQMFEPELLAEMRRFGKAIQQTVKADGTPLPNNGGTAGKLAGKAMDAIATAIGFKVGGFAGAGAAYTARLGSKGIQGSFGARAARRSFEGGAPALPAPRSPLDLSRLGTGIGVSTAYGAGQ